MAKYIIKVNDVSDEGAFFKLASTDAVKDFWVNQNSSVYTAVTITDAQFDNFKRGKARFNPSNDSFSDVSTEYNDSLTADGIQADLDAHISALDKAIKGHGSNAPSNWSTDLTALKAIDLSSLTFPMSNTCNWVDACEKNSISIPSFLEV